MLALKLFAFVLLVLSYNVAGGKSVLCYYGSWATSREADGKYAPEDINPFLCTHLLYAFAGVDEEGFAISLNPALDLPDNGGADNYGKFNALKEENSKLKTLLVFGGWGEGSAKYSKMAGEPTLRKNFIDSAVKLLQTHGFDGLDLDWEYPNRRDTVYGKEDIENFTTLMKELREEFDKYGLILAAAVSAVRDAASQSYDIPAISKYLHLVNLMTYDLHGAWDTVTGHNAALHKGLGDESKPAEDLYTVDQALDYWIKGGCPPEKIVLGIPFYGRTFKLADPKKHGLRAPAIGAGIAGPYTAENGVIGYNEFCVLLKNEPWRQRFDPLGKVPYAYKEDNWVTFDNVRSINAKVKYAKSLGIDKIMMWSLENDDFLGKCGQKSPLLKAINSALKAPTKPRSGKVTKSTVCKLNGYAVKGEDCSSFYFCSANSKGDPVPQKSRCPEGLYWDQRLQTCNYEEDVHCED